MGMRDKLHIIERYTGHKINMIVSTYWNFITNEVLYITISLKSTLPQYEF